MFAAKDYLDQDSKVDDDDDDNDVDDDDGDGDDDHDDDDDVDDDDGQCNSGPPTRNPLGPPTVFIDCKTALQHHFQNTAFSIQTYIFISKVVGLLSEPFLCSTHPYILFIDCKRLSNIPQKHYASLHT